MKNVEEKTTLTIDDMIPELPVDVESTAVVQVMNAPKKEARYRVHVFGRNVRYNSETVRAFKDIEALRSHWRTYYGDLRAKEIEESVIRDMKNPRPTVVIRDMLRPDQYIVAYEARWEGKSRIVSSNEPMKGGTTTWIEVDGPISVINEFGGAKEVLVSDHTWEDAKPNIIEKEEYLGCGVYKGSFQ